MVIRVIKAVLLLFVALSLVQCSGNHKESSVFGQSWNVFKKRFADHGRIIDTANQDISHSEGQGYGMLFAVFADDKKAFAQLWAWTRSLLQRDDHLFRWKYSPCPTKNQACIDDNNNATDGDILIAWALLEAAERWNMPEYRTQALSIVDSIESKLIRHQFGYSLLLPGEYGFDDNASRLQINLSYWVFPALIKFEQVTGRPVWRALIDSGETLIAKAQFGRWKLTPDWVMISDDGFDFDGALSQEYGYNACRVPIYLVLGDSESSQLLQPYLKFWSRPMVPATVNLENGTVATYGYSAGMQAIAKATKAKVNQEESPKLPTINAETDYYSASLILLSQLSLLTNK
jgi:endoglucanase